MSTDPLIGQEIDGYRILEELGRGGMGVVYKAEEVALARTVAIKMIAHGLAGEESFAQKFQREARSLARVSSPHITGIYTLRSTDIGLFIVMEYVGGGNLSDRLERGAMSWAEAKPLVLQALAGLHDAHSVGVVHRDIKPGNIMLTERGTVKVTDFGLAKLYAGDPTATVTRAISGTLHYMSPEQVQGAQDLDGRTDLYALGVTIFEMLSGRLPFETGGGEFATMRTIVEEEFSPLSRFAKKLPKGLEAAVMRSLAKAPDHRFADAEAMRAAFEAIPTDKAPPTVKAIPKAKEKPAAKVKPSDEATPGAPKETPAAIKAIQAAFKAIPAVFKADPARSMKRAEAGTVVEEDAYVPTKPPRKPLPIRPLLYALGGGLALLAFVLLAWLLLLRGPQSSAALSVVSDPDGAIVSLNGEQIGATPLELSGVDVSDGRLLVELAGYATEDTLLAFGEDLIALSFVLQRERSPGEAAALVVTSMPPGARVFIDGEPRGLTPLGLGRDNVGQGPLVVRIERPGFQAWQQGGVLPAEMDTLHADLQPVLIPGENRPPDRPIVVERPPDLPPVEDPPPDLPPVEDPPPDTPSCDRAALQSNVDHIAESLRQETNQIMRARLQQSLDEARSQLASCEQ